MTHTKRIMATIALLSLLSACGNTTSDRTLSGAGIGAGAGAVGSAVFGGAMLPAMVVGGVVGGAAGGLTSPNQVNLGKPLWE